MLYIVRVYDGNDVYEYEYGLLEHVKEHLKMEKCPVEMYEYRNGKEQIIRELWSIKSGLNVFQGLVFQ